MAVLKEIAELGRRSKNLDISGRAIFNQHKFDWL